LVLIFLDFFPSKPELKTFPSLIKKGRTLPPERTLRYAQVRYILYLPEL